MSEQVKVLTIPPCDINTAHGPAYADAALPLRGGSWGYVCRACFDLEGCRLGTGLGQRLVKEGS